MVTTHTMPIVMTRLVELINSTNESIALRACTAFLRYDASLKNTKHGATGCSPASADLAPVSQPLSRGAGEDRLAAGESGEGGLTNHKSAVTAPDNISQTSAAPISPNGPKGRLAVAGSGPLGRARSFDIAPHRAPKGRVNQPSRVSTLLSRAGSPIGLDPHPP